MVKSATKKKSPEKKIKKTSSKKPAMKSTPKRKKTVPKESEENYDELFEKIADIEERVEKLEK